MANQYGNQFQHPGRDLPPVQTHYGNQNQQPFSPPSYHHSPGALSPNPMNGAGIPPGAKRQRLSPNPTSPYPSPYAPTSPYAASPGSQYQYSPMSPAAQSPAHSFHQPQPYQRPNDVNARPPQGSMPPPKLPASKTQENADQLEKANARDLDVNNISDVLTGSGIDLRAEEDYMRNTFRGGNYGGSFNSQASTISPHNSFGQWPQGTNAHGAFQGSGPLSQPVNQSQQEAELLQKHERAARALAEASQSPLNDPFLVANKLRHRITARAYETGISVNLEGVFDKIPDQPHNVTRMSRDGPDGSIRSLQADSLINKNAPFVETLSLLSLGTEEFLRTILEDAFGLTQVRKSTSHGIVPPNLADLAVGNGEAQATEKEQVNITKTAWEAPDSAISPMTVMASNKLNSPRLPTPPTEAPPTPQPTVSFPNHVANSLKRKMADDRQFEKARLAKRQKRLKEKTSSTPAETPAAAALPPPPEKMTKKERDRLAKIGQTDEVLHRKANETANLLIGGKKKYSWMTGGGGGGGLGSGASTPRLNTALGSASGTATPAQKPEDVALIAKTRTFGERIEEKEDGEKIQIRDLIHVLEMDGKQRKTLATIFARMGSTDRDGGKRSAGASAGPDRRSSLAPQR